jgi:hypothetical protein
MAELVLAQMMANRHFGPGRRLGGEWDDFGFDPQMLGMQTMHGMNGLQTPESYEVSVIRSFYDF